MTTAVPDPVPLYELPAEFHRLISPAAVARCRQPCWGSALVRLLSPDLGEGLLGIHLVAP